MLKNMTYRTGRTYNGPQILEIELLDSRVDCFGFIDAEVIFTDASRGIKAKATAMVIGDDPSDLGPAVMHAYDNGAYQTV